MGFPGLGANPQLRGSLPAPPQPSLGFWAPFAPALSAQVGHPTPEGPASAWGSGTLPGPPGHVQAPPWAALGRGLGSGRGQQGVLLCVLSLVLGSEQTERLSRAWRRGAQLELEYFKQSQRRATFKPVFVLLLLPTSNQLSMDARATRGDRDHRAQRLPFAKGKHHFPPEPVVHPRASPVRSSCLVIKG